MSGPVEEEQRPRWGLIVVLILMGIGLLGAMAAVGLASNPKFKLPDFPEDQPEAPPQPVKSAEGHKVTRPDWRRKPTGKDIARYYPHAAQRRRIAGRVVVDCHVARDGRLADCKVTSETPPKWGFGDAALLMVGQFRMYPKTVDGQPVDDGKVRIPINFEPSR